MDKSIDKVFCIYFLLLGSGIMMYGLLISLDKLRMGRELIIRSIYIVFPWINVMRMGVNDVIERGEYTFFFVGIGIVIFFLVLLNKLHNRSYGVFNLEEKDVFLCVGKALENINLGYEIDGGGININNLCYMKITKQYPCIILKGENVKDEKLFKSVIDNIRNEVYDYKLPKRIFYKNGSVYIGCGLVIIALFSFFIS